MPETTTVITPEFRASYAKVFRAEPNQLKKDKSTGEVIKEYGCVALFAKGTDLTVLKNAAKAAAVEKWGTKMPGSIYNPIRDQGEREKEGKLPDGYEAGAFFINMTSRQRPGLVDANRQAILDETDFYSGCYARAQVVAKAYGGPGTGFNPGVAFYLQNVQKLRDGDPLSGRQKAEDAFEAVAGAGSTAGADADPFAP